MHLSGASRGTYLIAVFSQDFDLFVIEVAHRETLDFVVDLSVDAGAGRAYEYSEVHHSVSRALST
jgi:hypothetical protein